MIDALIVFIGGGVGSVARYGIARMVATYFPASFYGAATLLANFAACFILGGLVGAEGRFSDTPRGRLFFAVGFCGGLSTFSTFIAENYQRFYARQFLEAAGYSFISLVGGALAFLAGLALAKRLS